MEGRMEQLSYLVASLAVAHSLHMIVESTSVRTKLQRLSDSIAKVPLKPYPININTRLKSYSISIVGMLALTGVSYAILHAIAPPTETLLWIAFYSIVIGDIVVAYLLDKFHVDIEPLIRRFAQKKR